MSGRAVIDSTYLIALERIERLDLLPGLFQKFSRHQGLVKNFGRLPDWLNVREVRNPTLVGALPYAAGLW